MTTNAAIPGFTMALALLAGCAAMSEGKAAPALQGTSWSATGINSGGGMTGMHAGSKVTLDFSADGTLSGSAGCNNFTGRYEITGDQVKFPSAFASTRKMCADPAVMQQEQAFLKALSSSTSAHFVNGKLELRDAHGVVQLSASRS